MENRSWAWRQVSRAAPYPSHMNISAESRVIASFTFIVALLFGAWGALDNLVAGPPSFLLPEPEPARLFIARW